jgi:hypothetical protein
MEHIKHLGSEYAEEISRYTETTLLKFGILLRSADFLKMLDR